MKKLLLSILLVFLLSVNAVLAAVSYIDSPSAKSNDSSETHKYKIVNTYEPTVKGYDMDSVLFGRYPQSDVRGNIKEPIEWLVLEIQGNKALLISKNILEIKPYHELNEYGVNWNNCTIRKWLNSEFLKDAFSVDEQSSIETTTLVNKPVKTEEIESFTTYDKVFLFSITEVDKYFKAETYSHNVNGNNQIVYCYYQAEANSTPYAKRGMVEDSKIHKIYYDDIDFVWNESTRWRCRENDMCFFQNRYEWAKRGTFDGHKSFTSPLGIRPCIWVSLNNIKTTNNYSLDTNDAKDYDVISNGVQNNLSNNTSNYDYSSQIQSAKLISQYSDDVNIDQVDVVNFGSYPQSDASGNTKDPIEWIVLERQNDKALLLSKHILDCVKYYNSYNQNNNWSNSNYRRWLNNDFLYLSFNNNERNSLVDNNGYKVFLLNNNDINNYFNIYNQSVKNGEWDEHAPVPLYSVLVDGMVGDLWNFSNKINKLRTSGTKYTDYLTKVSQDKFKNGEIKYSEQYIVDTEFIFLDNGRPNFISYNYIGAHEGGYDEMKLPVRPAVWVTFNGNNTFNLNNLNDSLSDKTQSAQSSSLNSILGDNVHVESADVFQNPDGTIQIGGTPKEGASILQSASNSDYIGEKEYLNKKIIYNSDSNIIDNKDILKVSPVNNNNIKFLLTEEGYKKYKKLTEENLGRHVYVVYSDIVIDEIPIDSVFDKRDQVICNIANKSLRDKIVNDIKKDNVKVNFIDNSLINGIEENDKNTDTYYRDYLLLLNNEGKIESSSNLINVILIVLLSCLLLGVFLLFIWIFLNIKNGRIRFEFNKDPKHK